MRHHLFIGRFSIFITAFLITLVFLFGNPGDAVSDNLTWTGCGISKKAYMKEAAAAYKEKSGVDIKLSGGGATKGIRFTNAGLSDMGGTCRPALPDKFPQKEGEVFLTVVAWDALVAVVHPDNPVDSLTVEQLKKIMTGRITNWKEVGGPDQEILVVARTGKVSGVGYMARKMIFNDPEVEFTPRAKLVKSSGPLEKTVLKDKNAIGITGISSAKKRVFKGRKLKILKLDGAYPSVEAISTGKYPLFRPLYLATKGKPTGQVKAFLDWITSPEGQKVIESQGTVTLAQGKGLKAKFKYWEHTDRILNFNTLQ